MAPAKMNQWTVLDKENGFDGLTYGEVPVPKVGENEVLVKFRAASLNYRDLIIPKVRQLLRGFALDTQTDMFLSCRAFTPTP